MKKKEQVTLPSNGTPYWYVRVKPSTVQFEARETTWQDFMIDRVRYAQGNFFTNEKDALKLEMVQNEILSMMPPARPGSKKYM